MRHADYSLLFISWAPYCSRSDGIAAGLGGVSRMVYAPAWGSRFATVAFKYLSQTVQTLNLLRRHRPRAVFVMTPPVIAAFPVLAYAKLVGAAVVLDAHTAAFMGSPWERVPFLHRWASRTATATLVTGSHLRNVVESWGGRCEIVPDVPIPFPASEPYFLDPGFNVAVISSHNRDEPFAELLAAAQAVPDVTFHVTGDSRRVDPALRASAPSNLKFTGFLTDGEYVGLLLACDATAALTTRDHTMQRGAYEAIYLGKPVVTSDFPLLREAFPKGAIHVAGSADGIARGIEAMRSDIARFRTEAQELRAEKLASWAETAKRLRSLAGLTPHPHDRTETEERTNETVYERMTMETSV